MFLYNFNVKVYISHGPVLKAKTNGVCKGPFWATLKLTFSTFWWFLPENGQNSIVEEHVIILKKYQDNVLLKTLRVIFHWLGEMKYERNVLLTNQRAKV